MPFLRFLYSAKHLAKKVCVFYTCFFMFFHVFSWCFPVIKLNEFVLVKLSIFCLIIHTFHYLKPPNKYTQVLLLWLYTYYSCTVHYRIYNINNVEWKPRLSNLCMKRTPMALISFNYKVKEAFITGREGKTRPLKGKQWHKACLPYPKQAHVQRDTFSPLPLRKWSQ